jgi:murein L,D-transpeptidase YafK
VTKSRYRLDVLLHGERVKTYPIALGRVPAGAKRKQGDFRTPEGEYVLFPHHPSPSFGSCFYIGYPNEDDARRGAEQGLIDGTQRDGIINELRRGNKPPHGTALGGLILLHGTRERWIPALTKTNWTDGCIAMDNDDLLELLAAFDPDDRPTLLIRP